LKMSALGGKHKTARSAYGLGLLVVVVMLAPAAIGLRPAQAQIPALPLPPLLTPTVTGVSPAQGPTTGGTVVTITGSGFLLVSAVRFGSTPARSFTLVSSKEISAIAPAESPGTVDVTVATLLGTSARTSADYFTFLLGPLDQSTTYQIDAVHRGSQPEPFVPPLTNKWTRDLGGTIAYPVVAQGMIFATAQTTISNRAHAELFALDEATGTTRWGPIDLQSDPAYGIAELAYDEGRLFAVNDIGEVTAFDAATGVPLWSVPVDPYALPGNSHEPPVALYGTLYVPTYGEVWAIEETNGLVRWKVSTGGYNTFVAADKVAVYVTGNCNKTMALDPSTGSTRWTHVNCGAASNYAPVIDSGKVYVRNDDYPNEILDAANGERTGTFVSGPAPAFSGSLGFFLSGPVNGVVYQGSLLTARDSSTGATAWTFSGDGLLSSAPLVVGDSVYVGSTNGNLYALDAKTGALTWKTSLGAPVTAPNEYNNVPITGLAAGGGLLVVPATNLLQVFGP
jgi:outer membrane protein assembly factor BamB